LHTKFVSLKKGFTQISQQFNYSNSNISAKHLSAKTYNINLHACNTGWSGFCLATQGISKQKIWGIQEYFMDLNLTTSDRVFYFLERGNK
jgi:hypothetical protein